jgi:drug/metabolite transporter (DMT)-like permease
MVSTAGAIATALGSALGYALSSVTQHRAARSAGESYRNVGLLLHLAAQPIWLVGLLLAAGSLVLHAVALKFGELSLVQPLLISGVLFALPVSVLLDRRRPSLKEWLWAAVLVAGIGTFLVSASPSQGSVPTDTERLAALTGASVAVVAVIIGIGQRFLRTHRTALFGLAAGITYGVTASLIKQVAGTLHGDPLGAVTSWPLWVLLAIGGGALVLNQAAYRTGPLAASLPAMTMADPVVAIVIGILVFNEHIALSPGALVLEAASAAVVLVSTVQLARRAPNGDEVAVPPTAATP